jgi:hypothetical protein
VRLEVIEMTNDVELAATLEDLVFEYWTLQVQGSSVDVADWVDFHERKAALLARVAADPPPDIPPHEAAHSAALAETQLQQIRAAAWEMGGVS